LSCTGAPAATPPLLPITAPLQPYRDFGAWLGASGMVVEKTVTRYTETGVGFAVKARPCSCGAKCCSA